MDQRIAGLAQESDRRIVLLVLDGLGGLPREPGGRTELESAHTPNLDAAAAAGECGLHLPVGYGVAPGSAPGHLALFGYDPLDVPVGRGVVAALGIGFPLQDGDVAVRLNFASSDGAGRITDRRAGRIPTEVCAELCELLDGIELAGAELFVRPVKDYRAMVVLRAAGLSDRIADTDPQRTGAAPLEPRALEPAAEPTARLVAEFLRQGRERLANRRPANDVLLRGFAQRPALPPLHERFAMRGVAIAVYPDYKGVSRLVGMDVIEHLRDLDEQVTALTAAWSGTHRFFFMHHKYTDSAGEDGDFDGKVAEIERVDAALPAILALDPDVAGGRSHPHRAPGAVPDPRRGGTARHHPFVRRRRMRLRRMGDRPRQRPAAHRDRVCGQAAPLWRLSTQQPASTTPSSTNRRGPAGPRGGSTSRPSRRSSSGPPAASRPTCTATAPVGTAFRCCAAAGEAAPSCWRPGSSCWRWWRRSTPRTATASTCAGSTPG